MHVLGMAPDRPEHRAEQQRDERADERPRGNAVGKRLQRRAAGQVGRRGTEGHGGQQHGGLAFDRGPQRSAPPRPGLREWLRAARLDQKRDFPVAAGRDLRRRRRVLVLGVLIGIFLFRQRGHRAIAQRLTALGSRLAVEPHRDDGKVESALSYLEEVTGAATTRSASRAPSRSACGAPSTRSRSASCSVTRPGGVIFRNTQAEHLMASRYGEAIAAQAVTDVLAEGWANGVAERTIDIYGPPRRTLTIRATVIDDGRRSLGVLAVIEDVSERRRLEDIRRDFIANVSHELKTPMGALGLLAETLQFERDTAVAQRSPNASTTRPSA